MHNRERGRIMMKGINDELILAARLLATLFLIFGWRKVRDYSGTVVQMVQLGLPMPVPATIGSIFMELPVAFAIAIGAFTRPAAALMALYSLGTALIGHRYWIVKGADYVDSLKGFYKDLSIMGGVLLLCITGGAKYSIDALLGIAAP
jgi:putative oxidoreductase